MTGDDVVGEKPSTIGEKPLERAPITGAEIVGEKPYLIGEKPLE